MQLVRAIMFIQPLLFGFGFLAPLIAQIIARIGWVPPAGISPLVIGLAFGGGLGALATLRGRWL